MLGLSELMKVEKRVDTAGGGRLLIFTEGKAALAQLLKKEELPLFMPKNQTL